MQLQYTDKDKSEGQTMNTKEFNVSYKEVENGNGYIEGYASTWVREPDSYGDIVKQGAFKRTLQEWYDSGRKIPFLWSHGMDDLKAFIGSATADEDDYGLHFVAELDDTPEAQRVRELYKDGRLSKFSFAYDVLDQAQVELEDGRKANELRDLTIYEISAVTVPANDTAEVIAVKGGEAIGSLSLKLGETYEITPDGVYDSNGHLVCGYDKFLDSTYIKAGRRNSKKDEDAIRQAITLLQSVLDTAEVIEDGEDEAKANAAAEEPEQSNSAKENLLAYIKNMEESTK